jgi:hypothetical protein
MSRKTVTIDETLDGIINLVRGVFLLTGKDYNYTEVVNAAILYGICYWLGTPKDAAVKLQGELLTKQLKFEGLKDEERTRLLQAIEAKLNDSGKLT